MAAKKPEKVTVTWYVPRELPVLGAGMSWPLDDLFIEYSPDGDSSTVFGTSRLPDAATELRAERDATITVNAEKRRGKRVTRYYSIWDSDSGEWSEWQKSIDVP